MIKGTKGAIYFLTCIITMNGICAEMTDAIRVPLDGFAAVVNGKIITVHETLTAMQPVERQLQQTYKGEELRTSLEEAYTNTLESLIERELILDSFQRQQGTISQSAVNNRIDEIERTRFNNNRAELIKALAAENMTIEEWRSTLQNSMIVSFMREREVESRIMISPQAIRASYERYLAEQPGTMQVELRMVVFNRGHTEQEASIKRKQADDVRRRLLAGQDFAETARQLSEGIKAADGGYWGWIEPKTRRPELAAVLNTLEVGAVSDVIEADEMFYIVKIEGRRNAVPISFEEAQDKIRAELRHQQSKSLYDAWMCRLKRDAYIRRF